MAAIPEIDQNLVYQDTRIRLSEALEEATKYKVLAQQLLDRVNELEGEIDTLKNQPTAE